MQPYSTNVTLSSIDDKVTFAEPQRIVRLFSDNARRKISENSPNMVFEGTFRNVALKSSDITVIPISTD